MVAELRAQMRMRKGGEVAAQNTSEGSETGYAGADDGHCGFEDGPDSGVDEVPSNILLIELGNHDDPNYAHKDRKSSKGKEGCQDQSLLGRCTQTPQNWYRLPAFSACQLVTRNAERNV